MIPPARRLLLPLLLSTALLGQALHFLEHPAVEPCPGHLDGAHMGGVVHPAPDCPLCVLAGTAIPFLAVAAVFILIGSALQVEPERPPVRPASIFHARAPPK